MLLAGSGILLGMGIVFLFREPVKRRDPASGREARPDLDDRATAGSRVAIGPDGQPVKVARASDAPAPDPELPRKNREAIALLERGELERAVALFEECVAAEPGQKIFRQNLSEALARLSTQQWDRGGSALQGEAVANMARAVEMAPGREDLAARLAQMRQLLGSEAGNLHESSGHFDLSYDGSRDDLSFRTAEVFDALESAYLDFTELFGLDPVAQGRGRIRVVLYKREGFLGATGMGHWAGGLYDGSIRVPLEDLGREREQLRRVLRHELVHAFVHESGGRDVPGWLNEGLAQLLESNDPATLGRNLQAARAKLRGFELATLETLKGSLGAVGDEAAIGRAYAQSLLLVDFIAREHGDRVPYAMVAGNSLPGGIEAAFERRAGIPLALAFEDFRALPR